MTPEEFREAGHRLIDWIADYRANVSRHPVMARTEPGDVKRQLPALRIVDPLVKLCDARWCYGVVDGKVLYRDSNHLSTAGSMFLADTLRP